MIDKKRIAVLSSETKMVEIFQRVLEIDQPYVSYTVNYNGETGWLTVAKWDQEEKLRDEERVWRSGLPEGGVVFGIRFYSLNEILQWLETEAHSKDLCVNQAASIP